MEKRFNFGMIFRLEILPLKIQFPDIYEKCTLPLISMQQAHENGEVNIQFRRCLTENGLNNWELLFDMVKNMGADPNKRDEVVWQLDRSRRFTTKSLYCFLSHGG